MQRIVPLAAALLAAATALGGNTIRVTSPHFSFLVAEPDGWSIDLRSAAQIAHFVMTPLGTSWRNSDVAIFGRFVPAGEETVETYLRQDEDRFVQRCQLPQIKTVRLELSGTPQSFTVKSYFCPGSQNDLVAITDVPGYFAVFILSAQQGASREPSMAPFKEVLESFRWLPQSPPRMRDGSD